MGDEARRAAAFRHRPGRARGAHGPCVDRRGDRRAQPRERRSSTASGVHFANDLLHAGVVVVFVGGALAVGSSLDACRGRARGSWRRAPSSSSCRSSVEILVDPTALGMVYVLMGMLAFGPFTLSLRVMVIVAVPMLVGCRLRPCSDWRLPARPCAWCMAAVAALVIGAVLLRVRLIGIDALGALTNRNGELATRDSLTGVLQPAGRRGARRRARGRGAAVRRTCSSMFVDIDGLKAANDVRARVRRPGHPRVADGVRRACGRATWSAVGR